MSLPLLSLASVSRPGPDQVHARVALGAPLIEIVAQKRWSNNWQVLASYNYGVSRIWDDVGDNPNQDINANVNNDSYPNAGPAPVIARLSRFRGYVP